MSSANINSTETEILLNLFPHREAERKLRNQLFMLSIVGVLTLSGFLYYGVYSIFSARVSSEQQKVQYLKNVTSQLDKKIASVVDLRKKRDQLIAREGIIVDLQNRRDRIVRIFNALSVVTPNGIFLTGLKQEEDSITVHGYSHSNNQVADFMRNIDASAVFEKPELSIISTAHLGDEEVGQFTLKMRIRKPALSDNTKHKTKQTIGKEKHS